MTGIQQWGRSATAWRDGNILEVSVLAKENLEKEKRNMITEQLAHYSQVLY